ncbi:type IV secretory system conjugative DNA transfer family protein [Oxalobacteraceae bacterium A2-2]
MKARFNNAAGPQAREQLQQPGKVVPILVVLGLVAGLQAATQFFAHQAGHAPVLGPRWHQLYAPWDILLWAWRWYRHMPAAFIRAGSIGSSLSAVVLIVLVVARMVASNTYKAHPYLHGSARWADRRDIEHAGLLPRRRTWHQILRGLPPVTAGGVYVGAWVDAAGTLRYLRHDGPEHVLTYAPTRSGKGLGLVIPTLLSWPGSVVVTDLKGELWNMTAGWRHQHANNKVLRFEPADEHCDVHWNPLDECRIGTAYEVGDVQNLATLIVDPDGRGLENHWQKTSQALLVGVILHALYKRQNEGTPATLPYVDHLLADPSRSVAELWMEMVTYAHVDGATHPVVGAAGRDMMDRPDEEAGSVLSTAKSYLALYRDPVVGANVGSSTFRVQDLMAHQHPVSLYIVTRPGDKARLRPLVRVMINTVVRVLSDRVEFERVAAALPWWQRLMHGAGVRQAVSVQVRQKRHFRHRLLGMLDEFPSLGKLEILQESLAFLAAYGIKFYLICQDINQLKSRETGYGPDETITSNCHVQNAFPPNRVETAEHLSKLTGTTTVIKEQITTSGKRASALLGQVSRTLQEVQRPLLTPDECLRMPGPRKEGELIVAPGDMVVYVAGFPAIYGRQPLYFQDAAFVARAAVPPPGQSDRLRHPIHPADKVITL